MHVSEYFFQRWLLGQVVTKEKIEEAAEVYSTHLGPTLFNYDGGWSF